MDGYGYEAHGQLVLEGFDLEFLGPDGSVRITPNALLYAELGSQPNNMCYVGVEVHSGSFTGSVEWCLMLKALWDLEGSLDALVRYKTANALFPIVPSGGRILQFDHRGLRFYVECHLQADDVSSETNLTVRNLEIDFDSISIAIEQLKHLYRYTTR